METKKYKTSHIVFLIIIAILFATFIYLKKNFTIINFSEIVFALKYSNKGTDSNIFISSILSIFPVAFLIFLILFILFYDITFGKKKIIIKDNRQIYPFRLFYNHKKMFTWILLLISIFSILYSIGLHDYLISSFSSSSIIEDDYVNPKDVKVTFKEKRNLVFILVESLETSMFTKDQGGYFDYELMPELYDLLNDEDSVVFYDKNKAQTINMIEGASWTTASIVSNLSGVPLKANFSNTIYDSSGFMKDTYALGDLLKDNGYNNEVISGATTSFGGLKEYFSTHGSYSIIDEDSLDEFNLKMEKTDIGKWGFNDHYLFETAKKRLDILSKENKPFNLQLVTIDTHFIDGFVGDYSITKYNSQYANAYATESKLIYDFVSWIKTQDYYKDTTIVVAGDHLTMQSSFFEDKHMNNRYVYGCIINPRDKNVKENGRVITALDSYPTIVYALGGDIKGNRLGLGVNLFSNESTLAEKYGFEKFNNELKKNSDFYNNTIVK